MDKQIKFCKIFASLDVARIECDYTFTLRVTNFDGQITGGFIRFELAEGFANPVTTPTLTFNTTTRIVTWNFGTLAASANKEITFKSEYTGDPGIKIYENLIGGYNISQSFTVIPKGDTTTADCPGPDCCEDCNDDHVDFPTTPCQNFAEDTVTPEVLRLGRILHVHLNLPMTCGSKDINVGVFVTEVITSGEESEEEVPIAHRVIRRTANGTTGRCPDDKSCNCVQFMIDDTEETACLDRTFRVRTIAHYVDDENDSTQCQCNCNTQ